MFYCLDVDYLNCDILYFISCCYCAFCVTAVYCFVHFICQMLSAMG